MSCRPWQQRGLPRGTDELRRVTMNMQVNRQLMAVAAYLTEDTVPAGFDLPPGLTGPMPPAPQPEQG